MYLVQITNDDKVTTIMAPGGQAPKLTAAQIKRATNSEASFDLTMLPNNPGFGLLHSLTTRIKVTRLSTGRLEFVGRVLQPSRGMEDSGLVSASYTCADALDYLHDVYPPYKTLTGTGAQIITALLGIFNGYPGLETYKHIAAGDIGGTASYTLEVGPEKDIYDTIHDFVTTVMGYEMMLRVVSETEMYLDVQATLGTTSCVTIAIARNLKSLKVDEDPTSIITRAIPLGAVKQEAATTAESSTTEAVQHRVNLADIGKPVYIDLPDVMAIYGVQAGPVVFDDVTDANQLTARLQTWAKSQRPVQRKFTVTALDLSAIGKAAEDFDLYNYYPVKAPVVGVDEPLRVIGQTLDLINVTSESLTIGDKYKSGTDYALESLKQASSTKELVTQVQALTVVTSEATKAVSDISKTVTTIQDDLSNADLSGISSGLQSVQTKLNDLGGSISTMETDISNLQFAYNDTDKRLDALEAAAGGETK